MPLGGAFNVSNALAAATAAVELGVDPDTIVAGLAAAPPVPGRFEVIRAPGAPAVVVDYAHTPDGLEQVLLAARHQEPRRLVVVFGCGGDRDREKRPAMGAAASRLADVVVVTSDNPRHEDPLAIIDAVVGGADGPATLTVEPDRRAAIARALSGAGPSTSWWWPARATRPPRRSGSRSWPSTTGSWSGRSWPGWAIPPAPADHRRPEDTAADHRRPGDTAAEPT